MGRRSEQRIAISFPVTVHGSDSRGNQFTVATETFDISLSGASVKGLNTITEPGAKIDIESGDQNAWYSVQWIGKSGTSKAGRIGVRCLEPGKYIWGVPAKGSEPDTYDPSKPEPVAKRAARLPVERTLRRLRLVATSAENSRGTLAGSKRKWSPKTVPSASPERSPTYHSADATWRCFLRCPLIHPFICRSIRELRLCTCRARCARRKWDSEWACRSPGWGRKISRSCGVSRHPRPRLR